MSDVQKFDMQGFETLLSSTLAEYADHLDVLESGTDKLVDSFGDVIMTVPYLKLTFKSGSQHLADACRQPNIRITKPRGRKDH